MHELILTQIGNSVGRDIKYNKKPQRGERRYICNVIPREVQSLQACALPNTSKVVYT